MNNRKPVKADVALSRLELLCSRSEQCSGDLMKKLVAWQVPSREASEIMRRLREGRFVDDGRFARAYARDKMLFSGWGRYKIMRGLMVKRVEHQLIEEAIGELDAGEYEATALRVLRAKARTIKEGNTYEGRTKLFRAGASRGFETELLSRLIRKGDIWEPEE